MNNWTDDWTPPKDHNVLKVAGIILAYTAVIAGYLVLAIWGPAGAP